MAAIRENRKNGKIISYRFTLCLERDAQGKQIRRYRYAGSPAVSGRNYFNDVNETDYYYDAVVWAASEGITTGTSATTFSPADFCTRGQIVTFLYRYLKN